MVNQKSSSKKISNVDGIKMLILAGSVAVTVGGWGMLAADQLASTTTPTAVAQVPTSNTQQRFNQLSASQVSPAPRALTRTRSSR